MKKLIIAFVQSCPTCQQAKPEQVKYKRAVAATGNSFGCMAGYILGLC